MADTTCADSSENVFCDVCAVKNVRYTCPRCSTRTCSLECVKTHKESINCNGEKNNAAFVPISEYSNLTLLSDYRFLETVNRTLDRCKSNPGHKYSRYHNWLPAHLYKLKKNAHQKKINLEFLPEHFTRHQKNTTYLDFKTGVISWKLQFVFPQAGNISIDEKSDENERLSTILAKHVEVDTCEEIYKQHLKFYHATGIPGLEVLLKAECVKPKNAFYLLDIHSTIKENLRRKQILEHPVMYVIQKAFKDEYNLLDPSDNVPSIIPNKKDFLGKFTPFQFFDTVSYTNERKKVQEKAAGSIHESCKELRTYLVGDASGDEDSEEESPEEVKIKPRGKFEIPFYDQLPKM